MSSKRQSLRSANKSKLSVYVSQMPPVPELSLRRHFLYSGAKKTRKQISASNLEYTDFDRGSKKSLLNQTIMIKEDVRHSGVSGKLMSLKSEAAKSKRSSKPEQRAKYIKSSLSPYLGGTDLNFLRTMLQKMKPVKGPTASIKRSIDKYKQSNLDNVQTVIKNLRIEDFDQRMKQYSIRSGLPPNSKFFIVNSKDDFVKKQLISLGWYQNKSRNSKFFHLKWVINDAPHDYVALQQQQRFNHFDGNKELTNKNYLQKNIRRYNMSASQSNKILIPCSFDLQNKQEGQLFQREYQIQCVMAILKQFVRILAEARPNQFKKYLKISSLQIFQNQASQPKQLSKQEMISKDKDHNFSFEMNLMILCLSFLYTLLPKSQTFLYFHRKQWINHQYSIFQMSNDIKYSQLYSEKLTPSLLFITEILKIYIHFSQFPGFYSYGQNNIWLGKAVGVSRGNGIVILQKKQKMLEAANVQKKIIQKYIQKPLIFQNVQDQTFSFVEGVKFDIRQWVLVRSIYPLDIYIFDKCYFRLCSEKYNQSQFSNLKQHLTNYSQNKLFFDRKQQSVLSLQQFKVLIGHSVWQQKIYPQIQKIIYQTIFACSANMHNHPSSFQMYGFDLIISQNLQVWLLQVNLSPACEQRTPWMQQYVKQMTQGLLMIVMDTNNPNNHWKPIILEEEQKPIVRLSRKYKTHKDKVCLIQRWWRMILSQKKIIKYFNFRF